MSADEPELAALRRRSFAVAYRMLGSVAEAEDVVQEALLRFHQARDGGRPVASPEAFVATVTTRLAIDQLRSARVRREAYVGEWLPEPLLMTDPADDPARRAELAESLSLAFLALLERLTPEQRAALLLHDVFGYGYGEVAEIVATSEANARQLTVRARRRVAEGRPRFEASDRAREELADRFFAAAGQGDMRGLEELLAPDVVLHGDGGGKVPALARALAGRDRVVRALSAWARLGARAGTTELRRVTVNGQPGALVVADGALVGVMALDIDGGRIRAVRSIVNPDKLAHLGVVGDMRALLDRARLDPHRPRGAHRYG